MKIQQDENMKKEKIIICGYWPPSGPPAATNQVFLILMWMMAPLESLRRQKVKYFFLIFILRLNAF